MDWWGELGLTVAAFLREHGLLAAFVFLLIEEAGVPVPVPGDVLMIILGVDARSGQTRVWEAIAVMELATLIGASFLYAVARRAGRGLVYRYGRFMRLSPQRLDGVEHWLARHGFLAVFIGRLVPGLRIVTAVACGVFDVPFRQFLPAMGLGALAYITIYVLAGYLFGPPLLATLERLHLPFSLVGSLATLVLVLVWILRARRGLRPHSAMDRRELARGRLMRAGALAGLLSTVVSTLGMNVGLNLLGNVLFQVPSALIERTTARLALTFARDLQPLLLFVVVPAYVLVGVLWGAVYAAWVEPRLTSRPDWWKGVLFSMLPLATSLLVVLPLLGFGVIGLSGAVAVVAVGETIRHLAYGIILGLALPVMLARHVVRPLPHTPADMAPDGCADRALQMAETVER